MAQQSARAGAPRRRHPSSDDPSPQPLSEDDYRVNADLRVALRQYVRFSEEQARAAGITPQQLLLLLAVRGHPAHPEATIGSIAEYLQVRHHSASLLIDRAVRSNPPLLCRTQDTHDRRRALVSLAPEGARVLERITLANRTALGPVLGALKHVGAAIRAVGQT